MINPTHKSEVPFPRHVLLPYLPKEQIEAIYRSAPGDEIATGKFGHPESSAALVANAFGYFLDRPNMLPSLPGLEPSGGPAQKLEMEQQVRFPWTGGRHPCLDVVVRTDRYLIGIESKRYEPYRPKGRSRHSAAYERPVWGGAMAGYQQALQLAPAERKEFACLDVAQLARHALAIRTQIQRTEDSSRTGVLYYIYADPETWPDGTPVAANLRRQHKTELERFSAMVINCEVRFVAATYGDLLARWQKSDDENLKAHAVVMSAWLNKHKGGVGHGIAKGRRA